MQYIFEVHNLYDRNTPGEICPTVFIKDLIEVDSHCKGKEKSEKGLGYKLQKIANFLQNWVIDRYLQGFVKNVQEFFIPNRSSWPAWIVFFFRRADFIPKRHNDRLGDYAFLRYCDGVIPTTCLKILVKCDIS